MLDALGVLGGRETTVLLASLLRDKEAPVRRKAAMFLRRPAFSDVRAARALRQAATDADSVVKHHAGKEGERLLAAHDAQSAVHELGKAFSLSKNPRFLLPLGLAFAEAGRPC